MKQVKHRNIIELPGRIIKAIFNILVNLGKTTTSRERQLNLNGIILLINVGSVI